MTSIRIDLNTGQRYRVFAGKGNTLSEDGVTVIVSLLDADPDVTFDFWTRQDAVAFFQCLATAAETCPVQEAGDAGTVMAEGATTSWDVLEAVR